MPRSMSAAALNVITAEHAPVCVFVELQFPSGFVRFTNAGQSMDWNGSNWIGAGSISAIEPISEVATPQAAALNIRFSGIDTSWMSAILADAYQGNPATIWVAPLSSAMVPVSDPVMVFQGRMDEPVVTVGDQATIQLSLENRFADWDRPRLRMYADADQKQRHAGDRYFEFVAQLESTSIVWGTYRGPVAPDPLKVFNRTVDRFLGSPVGKLVAAPFGITKPTVAAARNIGDKIAKVFGW
jgi:hypothetical protein